MRLPATGIVLSGLGDTALLGSESWFVPGMGAFAAAHACYITALARDGAARGVRPRVAAGYAALWAILIAVLWRGLGSLRVPVAAYSLLLVSMAVLASGRNRRAAAGGALFVASDALIACSLAGIKAVPRQESAVMPTYVAAQFLLAVGYLARSATPQDLDSTSIRTPRWDSPAILRLARQSSRHRVDASVATEPAHEEPPLKRHDG